MPDFDRYQDGGVVFPLTSPGAGGTLLDTCDPAVKKLLDYFEFLINNDLGSALTDVSSAGFAPITANVATKLPLDPLTVAQFEQLSFPLLAVYPVSDKYEERTANWEHAITTMGVAYILPPLTGAQAERIVPVLRAVQRIIRHGTRQKQHPLYLSNLNVLADASIESAWFRSARFGRFALSESLDFHSWMAEFEVSEAVMPYAPTAAPFIGIDAQVEDNSVQPGNPVVVDNVKTDVG